MRNGPSRNRTPLAYARGSVSPVLGRWIRFNAVGFLGIFIQLAALGLLKDGLGLHYLAATALAVEAAVLHNFAWHEQWTWRDRTRGAGAIQTLLRLLRFNASTGLISILANVALMRLLVGWLGLDYLPANVLAIALCSLANFAASEWFAFAPVRVAVPIAGTLPPPAPPFPPPQ